MNDEQTDRISQLEQNLGELIHMLVDPSLWNFLSENERIKVSKIIKASSESKLAYGH
jgi:hypothetical protein